MIRKRLINFIVAAFSTIIILSGVVSASHVLVSEVGSKYASCATEIKYNQSITVSFDGKQIDCDVYKFVPENTGTYAFTGKLLSGSTGNITLQSSKWETISYMYIESNGTNKKIFRLEKGKTYYLQTWPRSNYTTSSFTVMITDYYEDGAVRPDQKNGWVESGSSKYYYVDDVYVTGWYKIDGYWYYFDLMGCMKKAVNWVKIEGKNYFFVDNHAVTGFYDVYGHWYYFDDKGLYVTGWNFIDGYLYYFSPSTGYMAVNTTMTIEGVSYQFDKDGHLIENSGWKQNNGKWYYYESNGSYVTGWKTIESKWYYFQSDGAMVTGWIKLSNIWYYFESSGAMAAGWKQLDGVWYYFESSGAMASGWKKVSNIWYYFESSGVMVTGWKQLGGVWYYFETSGAMSTGWKLLSGVWYYFDNGKMLTGTHNLGGKTYVFDGSGHLL